MSFLFCTRSGIAAPLLVGILLGVVQAQGGKDELKLSDDEKTLLRLLNESREKKKLPPLKPNPILFKVARAHSANMARQEKMAHELDGKKPKDRVEEAGYDYRSVGENVAYAEKDDDPLPLAEIHDRWMKSKVHKDNILAAKFEEVGLGIEKNKKGDFYYTQVFGTQRKKP